MTEVPDRTTRLQTTSYGYHNIQQGLESFVFSFNPGLLLLELTHLLHQLGVGVVPVVGQLLLLLQVVLDPLVGLESLCQRVFQLLDVGTLAGLVLLQLGLQVPDLVVHRLHFLDRLFLLLLHSATKDLVTNAIFLPF